MIMEAKRPSTVCHAKRRRQPEDEVSTVLTLWDPTWPTTSRDINSNNNKKRKSEVEEVRPKPSAAAAAAYQHHRMTNSSEREKLESVLVSTQSDHHDDQIDTMRKKLNELDSWGIRKTLTPRDLGHLYVPTNMMKKHVLPYEDDKFFKGIGSREGAPVIVVDCDTHSYCHQTIFKLCDMPSIGTTTGGSRYVFDGTMWHPGFVKRRQLKVGDEIGLHRLRKQAKPTFLFSLLKRANSVTTCTSSSSM